MRWVIFMGLFSTGCAPTGPLPAVGGPFIFSVDGVSSSAAKFGSAAITTKNQIWEWGYSGIHLSNSDLDGAGLPRSNYPCFGAQQGCSNPIDHDAAYAKMVAYFNARNGSKGLSGNGHYYFHHMAAANGAAILGSEVGENINSTNTHIAFTRGAAKQYSLPWGIDFSSWYGPSILAYDNTWGAMGGPDNGHSISLHKRTFYAAYAAGANWVQAEAGVHNLFQGDSLTALGTVAKEFYDFTVANPDLGKPYNPIAILIPRNHGLGLGSFTTGLSYNVLTPSAKEVALMALFESIWPGSFSSWAAAGDESTYQSNGSDLFDVITEDAVTTGYKIILDSTHTTYNVADVLPFGISGDIQYLLNKKNDHDWTITLINNKGVTKAPLTATITNPAAAATVTLTGPFTAATALRGSAVSPGATIQITVAPGEIAVYSVSI